MSLRSCSSKDLLGRGQPPGGNDRASTSRRLTERLRRLGLLLLAPVADLGAFRSRSEELTRSVWLGIPDNSPLFYRADSWRIILGYLPLEKARREDALRAKRAQYFEMVSVGRAHAQRFYLKESYPEYELNLLKQVRVRTPDQGRPAAHESRGQDFQGRAAAGRDGARALRLEPAHAGERLRAGTCGHSQGINDLLTLFVTVFLRPYAASASRSPAEFALAPEDVAGLSDAALREVEADCFHCLSEVLSHLLVLCAHAQDNYTEDQPGVYRSLRRVCDLVRRIDAALFAHLDALGVDFMQFPFRWMNCMLVREMPADCAVRLWDTYVAEVRAGIPAFHEYVSAAFLCLWSEPLRSMDYQRCLLFLQQPPTSNWTPADVDSLISKAWVALTRRFVLKTAFHDSPSHLSG